MLNVDKKHEVLESIDLYKELFTCFQGDEWPIPTYSSIDWSLCKYYEIVWRA